jgi:5-formyltetrahydrofolate cyclo-ligase
VTARSKDEWRRAVLSVRRARPPAERQAAARALTRAVLELAAAAEGPVAAHLPIGGEPWSAAGVEALRAAGHEVLLPVVAGRGPLDWARYTGPDGLAPGPMGLREPAGPRLGANALASAALVLLPGLAADRAGVRLGRGAGYYDRSLPLVAPGTALVVVLHDDELVDALPAEPHDRPVTGALLPGAGHVPLGKKG